jgi:hypothetical protein
VRSSPQSSFLSGFKQTFLKLIYFKKVSELCKRNQLFKEKPTLPVREGHIGEAVLGEVDQITLGLSLRGWQP